MKQMGVREFLRGGYLQIQEPTTVARHGQTLFTVLPHNEGAWLRAMARKTAPRAAPRAEPVSGDKKE